MNQAHLKDLEHPLFQLLATNDTNIVILLDSNLKIIFFNTMAEKVFSCGADKVIGTHFSTLCPELKIALLVQSLKNNTDSQLIATNIFTFFNNIQLSWRLFNANIESGCIYMLIATRIEQENQTEIVRLKTLLENMPCNVYWMDKDCKMIGCNQNVLSMLNITQEDYVGKTYEELSEICHWPEGLAQKLKNDDLQVLRTGQPIFGIEDPPFRHANNTLLHLLTSRVPIRDSNGEIIGVAGISVDITERKNMEKELEETASLKLENAVQKKLTQEQEKFIKAANQVAHDIRSPLASLLMIVKSCKEIPEADRIALREAAVGISDIANNLLSRYQKKEPDSADKQRQAILVSTVLMQILTEKKYQYQNLQVKFDCYFGSNSYFCFIKISPSALKRMLSNLINNAVDAFEKRPGKVDLNVDVDSEWVKISIQDNGKGMPKEVIDKILQNIAVTAGKDAGHGIGLTQVREALQNNQGEMTIESKLGEGTKITLIFPRIKAPKWIAEEIVLEKEDMIVILDDDASIHGAWDAHFELLLQQEATLQQKHFTVGNEALTYIRGLPEEQKKKVFLLTDYELLKQEINGLHVIAQSGVQRSILVTSHYADLLIQNQAAKTGTQILPKQLASEVSIKVIEPVEAPVQDQTLQSLDLIIVDDDEEFVKTLMDYAFDHKTVDSYYDPNHFLSNASKYAKDTAICLDNNFSKSSLRGLDVAEILHEQGFTRIYILSGEEFDQDRVPDYVTVIRKDDIDRLQEI